MGFSVGLPCSLGVLVRDDDGLAILVRRECVSFLVNLLVPLFLLLRTEIGQNLFQRKTKQQEMSCDC